ncbi:MAG: Hydrolase, partial [Patescibacteria group bacterium]|nr:Hydrolase [Patescibacteria group bacterium]
MHSIQEHILRTLMNENPARYSSLRPPAVEGNVFTYHLGQALKKGLVEKQGEKYGLTRNGKQFIDSLSS